MTQAHGFILTEPARSLRGYDQGVARVNVRAANQGDSLPIAELAVLVWNDSYHTFLSKEALATEVAAERSLKIGESIRQGDVWLVATDAIHAIVGFVQAKPDSRWADWHLGAIYIHPRWQRQGIGRLLMRTVVNELERRAAKSLSLRVFAANHAAKTFYDKLGARLVASEGIEISEQPLMTEILLFDSLERLKRTLSV